MRLTPDGLLHALSAARQRIQLFACFSDRGRNLRFIASEVTLTQFFGVTTLVRGLTDEQQLAALTLYTLEGQSVAQVAEHMGLAEQAVHDLIAAGIATMVHKLGQREDPPDYEATLRADFGASCLAQLTRDAYGWNLQVDSEHNTYIVEDGQPAPVEFYNVNAHVAARAKQMQVRLVAHGLAKGYLIGLSGNELVRVEVRAVS